MTDRNHPPKNDAKNQTLHYYNENAADFCAGTLQADMSHLYDQFLCHIPPGGRTSALSFFSGYIKDNLIIQSSHMEDR